MTRPSNIKHMTFDELRNELGNCSNNPVKESIVRHMMKQRYYEHQRQKEMIKRKKMMRDQQLREQQNAQRMQQTQLQNQETQETQEAQSNIDDLIIDIQDNISNEGDMVARMEFSSDGDNESDMMARQSYGPNDNNLTPRDFLDPIPDSNNDSKSAKEITRDHLNNNLMSRMGADIAIRKFKDPRHSGNSDFESPFANGSGDGYASFDKIRR